MVDAEIFAARLHRLDEVLRNLETVRAGGRDAFLASETAKASAERWLQIAGECAIDLANHVIAAQKLRPPASYRAAFETLEAAGLIDTRLASDMKGWAGLRNVLVHLYLAVDHEILWNVIDRELDGMRSFSRAMKGLL